MAAAFMNKPLTSFYTGRARNSELCSVESNLFNKQNYRFSANSLAFVKKSISIDSNIKNNGIVCKAVSVQPQTEIEGLNIAEDVTQVGRAFLCVLLFFNSIFR